MRICPVMLNKYDLSNKGQLKSFQSMQTLNYQNQNDAFVRLAIASMRDNKIENELKGMKLI